MSKFSKLLCVVFSIVYLYLNFFEFGYSVYQGNRSISGSTEYLYDGVSIFNIIIGTIVVLLLLYNLNKNNINSVVDYSKYLIFVSVIEIVFIYTNFTVMSSSLLSSEVGALEGQGYFRTVKPTIFPFIVLGVSILNFLLMKFLPKKNG